MHVSFVKRNSNVPYNFPPPPYFSTIILNIKFPRYQITLNSCIIWPGIFLIVC